MRIIAYAAAIALLAGVAVAQTQAPARGDAESAAAANAAQPARGANSFTEGQARSRLEDRGFANVSDLRKDDADVWRGRAQKGGQTVSVWLDYKGNVGQQ